MSLIDATLSLIDEDQGVCPDGHPCALDFRPSGTLLFTRICDTVHPDLDHELFRGQPLARWGVTEEEVDDAVDEGADANMAYIARSTIREGLW